VNETARLRADAMERARALLASARSGRGQRQHRGLRASTFAWRMVVVPIALATVLVVTLLTLSGPLMSMWRDVILNWASMLDLPLRAGAGSQLFEWTGASPRSRPDAAVVTAVLGAVVVMFAASRRLPDRLTPVKYLLRFVAVLQLGATVLFIEIPERFGHSVEGHLDAILWAGVGVMACAVLIVCCAQGLLRVPLGTVLLQCGLVLGYFTLMLPHKAVLHLLILQHFSVLLMPLLYFCFGVLFDIVVLNALFAWLVSDTPQGRLG
jgi:hypothetical protein